MRTAIAGLCMVIMQGADHTLAATPAAPRSGRSVWPAGHRPERVSGGDGPTTMAPPDMTARTRELRERRAQVEARQDAYTAALAAGTVTEEERAWFAGSTAEVDQLTAAIEFTEARAAANAGDGATTSELDRRDTSPARVTREEPIYRPDGGRSWFSDLFRANNLGGGDSVARENVERNTRMVLDQRFANASPERRAATVANLAGAVPPTYLVESFAPIARAGRPFLNSLNAMDLPPDGVSFVIPRGTTGQSVAATAEGAAWADSNFVATDDTVTVNLFAGSNTITRTLLMRGGPTVDRILFPDMLEAYHVAVDASGINGSGTAPAHRGVLNVSGIISVTYTDASPTFQEFRARLIEAIGQVGNQRYLPPVVVYMTPLRWAWCTNAVDTAGRPLVTEDAPQNPAGIGGPAIELGQINGQLAMLPVIVDANIPANLGAGTNEDRVIVARTTDYQFWEDDIMQFTMEQAPADAPGDVLLAAGAFSLFHAGRYPKSTAVISGTGLVTPTF